MGKIQKSMCSAHTETSERAMFPLSVRLPNSTNYRSFFLLCISLPLISCSLPPSFSSVCVRQSADVKICVRDREPTSLDDFGFGLVGCRCWQQLGYIVRPLLTVVSVVSRRACQTPQRCTHRSARRNFLRQLYVTSRHCDCALVFILTSASSVCECIKYDCRGRVVFLFIRTDLSI